MIETKIGGVGFSRLTTALFRRKGRPSKDFKTKMAQREAGDLKENLSGKQ